MSNDDPTLQQRLNELKGSFRGQIGKCIAVLFEQTEHLPGGPENGRENTLAEIIHL